MGQNADGSLLLGKPTFFVWGYKGRMLLARIDNFKAADVTSAIQTQIDNAVSASDNQESQLAKVTIMQSFNTIRTNLLGTQSMITYYTYDPFAGVTSITDNRGNTTYFEYDNQGRFINSKDGNMNLINETKYNYKN